MPEGFLQDESIGVKWKLYAIINGFWIGGKTCFGGNEFFAAKLGVSERQIRNGLSQLEEDGYIERVITGNLRVIRPKAHVVEAEVSLPGGGSQSSAEAEAALPHISVSISESIITAKPSALTGFTVEEEKPRKPQEPKNTTKRYQELVEWLRDLTGAPMPVLGKQYAALKRAREADISITRLKDRAEELMNDAFYRDKGFDWADVVSSFNKRA